MRTKSFLSVLWSKKKCKVNVCPLLPWKVTMFIGILKILLSNVIKQFKVSKVNDTTMYFPQNGNQRRLTVWEHWLMPLPHSSGITVLA